MRPDVHQRMNANGLLPYDLFFWNKAKQGGEIFECGLTKHYYYLHTNGIVHSDYALCAQRVSFFTPDSSSSLPVCSMRVLPPPLLLINCLSCSLSGGLGPPSFPLLAWPHFPQGPGTFPLLRRLHWKNLQNSFITRYFATSCQNSLLEAPGLVEKVAEFTLF